MPLRYLSICSGIEAATVAWHPLGWVPAGFADIEKFPSAVLAHHYPHVPNHGDMTKFNTWPEHAINLLVGGTPCQDFSVAGLRKGLDDPRGNLTLTFLALARRYRPRWVVWENVPGVLSDKTGAFGALLGGLAELGYGWAYRVLDAQYFGVAQRRRRVFVVAYLGAWQPAAAVLFEPESLRGDPSPRRGPGERVTPTIRAGAPNGGPGHGARSGDSKDELIVPVTVGALTDGAHMGGGSMVRMPTLEESLPAIAWALQERDAKGADSSTKEGHLIPTPRGGFFDAPAATLRSGGDGNIPSSRGEHLVPVAYDDRNQIASSDVHHTLRSAALGSRVADAVACGVDGGEVAFALRAGASHSGDKGDGGMNTTTVASSMAVRRLTPRECERLQGFPDDYTLIPWRGNPPYLCPDGPRYRALGNSMAVPVMRWIGQRIALCDSIVATPESSAA